MTDTTGDHEVLDQPKNPWLTDDQYSKLEFIARVFLPGLAIAIGAIGTLWGWEPTAKVAATVVALDALLGVFLGRAQKAYDNSDAKYDGSIDVEVNPEDGSKLISLNLEDHPDEIVNKDQILFKVNAPPAS